MARHLHTSRVCLAVDTAELDGQPGSAWAVGRSLGGDGPMDGMGTGRTAYWWEWGGRVLQYARARQTMTIAKSSTPPAPAHGLTSTIRPAVRVWRYRPFIRYGCPRHAHLWVSMRVLGVTLVSVAGERGRVHTLPSVAGYRPHTGRCVAGSGNQ